MREQIKELCFFMICGQTLLYFQSGKKYEKICRMILELLVLAGIVGMILNFLQSIGIRKGEMQALGGAVAGMQRSMEEALNRQLDPDDFGKAFMPGISVEGLVEKYTMEEIRVQYQYFAEQYGFEMAKVERKGDKLQVYLRERHEEEADGGGGGGAEASKEEEGEEMQQGKGGAEAETGMGEESGKMQQGKGGAEAEKGMEEEGGEIAAEGEAAEVAETAEIAEAAEIAEIAEIRQVEIERIRPGEGKKTGEEDHEWDREETGQNSEARKDAQTDEKRLETFRRQLALVFAMEEEKLEVILID